MNLLVCLIIFAQIAFFSRSEASSILPTAWYWRTGSPTEIKEKINDGFRIIDVELLSAYPLRLTALFVQNEGAHRETWWWYYNVDVDTIKTKLVLHQARIVDFEPYIINDQLLFAVVLVPNKGKEQKKWWYYYDVSPAFITSRLKETGARLIDVDTYQVGSGTQYSVVMVENDGADKQMWWWYHDVSPEYIERKLAENKARLLDLEYNGGGNFTVIMEQSADRWLWYFDVTDVTLMKKASEYNARLVHVEPYWEDEQRKWAGIMIRNP